MVRWSVINREVGKGVVKNPRGLLFVAIRGEPQEARWFRSNRADTLGTLKAFWQQRRDATPRCREKENEDLSHSLPNFLAHALSLSPVITALFVIANPTPLPSASLVILILLFSHPRIHSTRELSPGLSVSLHQS